MSQAWYGNQGPGGAGHASHGVAAVSQRGYSHPMQHGSISGMHAQNYNIVYRNSPTVGRPPSSASTTSTSSYAASSIPAHPGSKGQEADSTSHMGHYSMASAHPQGHQYAVHNQNRHGNMVHAAPGAFIATRYHPSQMYHELNEENAPPNDGYRGYDQASLKFAADAPGERSSSLPVVHQPVPYRYAPRQYPMMQHSGNFQHSQFPVQYGYYEPSSRGVMPPVSYHHPTNIQQQYEIRYAQYQRPMYESPQTVVESASMNRSPTPPPHLPVQGEQGTGTNGTEAKQNKPDDTASLKPASTKTFEEEQDESSEGKQDSKAEVSASTKEDKKGGDIQDDDDAASILLQLSGVPSKDSTVDDIKDEVKERPLSTINTEANASMISERSFNRAQSIEAKDSADDDATIATNEGLDCAPDLTSEPSADSLDQRPRPESDFPCPIPENYPTRLALKNDGRKLNSLHCFLREELLEVFVVKKSSHKSPTHSPWSSVGRVGLRCVHCAMAPQGRKENQDDEAPMAVFYPKSIAEIYRLVTSWQRCHLRKCRNLPPAVRSKWQSLRESDKSRGKTHYWVTSAKEIGLTDCQSRGGGIRFVPDSKKTADEREQESEDASSCIRKETTSKLAPVTHSLKEQIIDSS